jgi:putative FmdB family regulatory protein
VPLYEYQCKKCKHKFEKIQKFSDRPIKKCPECGSPVEKIQHAPNVQFKGSGWYVTDYGGKKDGADSGSEKKEAADGTKEKGKDSKEKDSKPKKVEAKSETKSESKKTKD